MVYGLNFFFFFSVWGSLSGVRALDQDQKAEIFHQIANEMVCPVNPAMREIPLSKL